MKAYAGNEIIRHEKTTGPGQGPVSLFRILFLAAVFLFRDTFLLLYPFVFPSSRSLQTACSAFSQSPIIVIYFLISNVQDFGMASNP